uniref:FAM65 N-terminal domain-containing protein n=1 Tax=Acrobeloides nanus TaxID=290746 RepID=A0A914DVX6_9BILA
MLSFYNSRPYYSSTLPNFYYKGTKAKSGSVADLRPNGHLTNNPTTYNCNTISTSTSAISGLNYRSPLINHRGRLKEKAKVDEAMSALECEMFGMMGRLHFEVKAIVGFARLASGDVFEISVKHGIQKWKTRGKTQPDKTQKWEMINTVLNCQPDVPVVIKVSEVKFFKSRILNERSFDPVHFFSTQPQLVTMNLNTIGTMKLQLVVTWVPLLTSKSPMRGLNTSQSAQGLRSHSSTLSEADRIHGLHGRMKPSASLSNAKLMQDPDPTPPPPKIILREKKRGRPSNAIESQKEKWRSSTTILDDVYKDIAKSIPSLDEVDRLASKKSNPAPKPPHFHKATASESDMKESPATLGYTSAAKKSSLSKDWNRSISMSHLASIQESDTTPVKEESKPKPSSLKKNRFTPQLVPSSRPTDSDDSSEGGRKPAPIKIEGLKKIDGLLELVDALRVYLGKLRNAEYTELAAFEAIMLNWEAVLKLNRATMLEDHRIARGNYGSRQSAGARRIAKRASMYNQHSPSTGSDELDDNVLMHSGDQISENDSGIDSLRQHVSPYNTHTNGYLKTQTEFNTGFGTTGRPVPGSGPASGSGSGPAQRRFKQFRERRKSLGIVLNSMVPTEYERMFLNSDKFWEPDQNEMSSATAACLEQMSSTASGNSEVDDCLKHHLKRAIISLKQLNKIHGPLEYKMTEMLCRMEQDTVALEELLHISDSLPSLPNITNLLADLGANSELQEIWLSTSYPINVFLLVPIEHLRRQIKAYLMPIVEARYPELVNKVLETVMSLLSNVGDWDPEKVSLFQFVSLFRGKHLTPFIENLAHEAWITSNLMSKKPSVVREVMERLRNVPVVPPLESLRHIGLVLIKDLPEINESVEKYLRSACKELKSDLTACYVCLLEHKDEQSRRGACRALAVLQQENVFDFLKFVVTEDDSKIVRDEARKALDQLGCLYHDYEEVTKI